MKLIDWVLLALIFSVVLLALRSVLKHGGGECSGNCSGCHGCASKGKYSSDGRTQSGEKGQEQRTISRLRIKSNELQKGK